MECWNDGILGMKSGCGLILASDECRLYKIDLIPLNTLFQHSTIPIPQDIQSWQSRLSLTWPGGPGFQ